MFSIFGSLGDWNTFGIGGLSTILILTKRVSFSLSLFGDRQDLCKVL